MTAYYEIVGVPRTKKNSPVIARTKAGGHFVLPSAAFRAWQKVAVPQLQWQRRNRPPISEPVGLQAMIYPGPGVVVGDLINYLQAVCDALQAAQVVLDDGWIRSFDHSRIVENDGVIEPGVRLKLTAMAPR